MLFLKMHISEKKAFLIFLLFTSLVLSLFFLSSGYNYIEQKIMNEYSDPNSRRISVEVNGGIGEIESQIMNVGNIEKYEISYQSIYVESGNENYFLNSEHELKKFASFANINLEESEFLTTPKIQKSLERNSDGKYEIISVESGRVISLSGMKTSSDLREEVIFVSDEAYMSIVDPKRINSYIQIDVYSESYRVNGYVLEELIKADLDAYYYDESRNRTISIYDKSLSGLKLGFLLYILMNYMIFSSVMSSYISSREKDYAVLKAVGYNGLHICSIIFMSLSTLLTLSFISAITVYGFLLRFLNLLLSEILSIEMSLSYISVEMMVMNLILLFSLSFIASLLKRKRIKNIDVMLLVR